MAFYDNDITDNLSGKDFRSGQAINKNGAVIQFYHVPTINTSLKANTNNSQATFKAFLTTFKDNFKVNWNAKETFGRMDAIQTYKNTQRTISVAFDVPSSSEEEANLNFFEIQKLITMQYPVYESVNIATLAKSPQSIDQTNDGTFNMERDIATAVAAKENSVSFQSAVAKGETARFMSSPPLLYIKFMNWISDASDLATANTDKLADVTDALVGIVSEVNFSPDLEQGFHFINSRLVPKLFTVDLNITIIHTSELGWSNTVAVTGEKLQNYVFGQPKGTENTEGFTEYESFPYGIANTFYNKNK
jgi:hypothetical protein